LPDRVRERRMQAEDKGGDAADYEAGFASLAEGAPEPYRAIQRSPRRQQVFHSSQELRPSRKPPTKNIFALEDPMGQFVFPENKL
jgi:hypothetical protein